MDLKSLFITIFSITAIYAGCNDNQACNYVSDDTNNNDCVYVTGSFACGTNDNCVDVQTCLDMATCGATIHTFLKIRPLQILEEQLPNQLQFNLRSDSNGNPLSGISGLSGFEEELKLIFLKELYR